MPAWTYLDTSPARTARVTSCRRRRRTRRATSRFRTRSVRVLHNQAPGVAIAWPPDRLWLAVAGWAGAGAARPGIGRRPADGGRVTWRLDGATICAAASLRPPRSSPASTGWRSSPMTVGAPLCGTQYLTAFADPADIARGGWASSCARSEPAPRRRPWLPVGGLRAAPPGWTGRSMRCAPRRSRSSANVVEDSLLEVFTLDCRTGPVEVFEARGRRWPRSISKPLPDRRLRRDRAHRSSTPATAASWLRISGSAARSSCGRSRMGIPAARDVVDHACGTCTGRPGRAAVNAASPSSCWSAKRAQAATGG